MSQQTNFEREERRSVVVLGLLAIIVGLLVSKLVEGLLIFLLLGLLFVWAAYAIFALIYVSDDIFPSQTFRVWAKRIALTCLFGYSFAILVFTVALAVSIAYPSTAGLAAIFSGIIIAIFTVWITNTRIMSVTN